MLSYILLILLLSSFCDSKQISGRNSEETTTFVTPAECDLKIIEVENKVENEWNKFWECDNYWNATDFEKCFQKQEDKCCAHYDLWDRRIKGLSGVKDCDKEKAHFMKGYEKSKTNSTICPQVVKCSTESTTTHSIDNCFSSIYQKNTENEKQWTEKWKCVYNKTDECFPPNEKKDENCCARYNYWDLNIKGLSEVKQCDRHKDRVKIDQRKRDFEQMRNKTTIGCPADPKCSAGLSIKPIAFGYYLMAFLFVSLYIFKAMF
jgi:hypothetical protein